MKHQFWKMVKKTPKKNTQKKHLPDYHCVGDIYFVFCVGTNYQPPLHQTRDTYMPFWGMLVWMFIDQIFK